MCEDVSTTNPRTYIEPKRLWVSESSRIVEPTDLTVDDIDYRDICHSLAMQNRFNGYTPYPYSVAQHTIAMVSIAKGANVGRHILQWMLLHDAPEAYLSDIPSPVKHALEIEQDFADLERKILQVMADHFGLRVPTNAEWQQVLDWDLSIGALECQVFGVPVNDGRQPPYVLLPDNALPYDTRVRYRDLLSERVWITNKEALKVYFETFIVAEMPTR